ncbi:hypothetical protein [Streptomyces exfoliatus]|uniref:hypothetical protein n=1 Tax=Streptomyces exfoliatus TaxID=1905 RepID=UPI0004662007|nr:hypothetical protein [Streptomyces exfoliatus]
MRLRLRDDALGLMAFGQGRRAGRWSLRFRTVASLTLGFAFLFVPSAAANPFCYIPMVCEVKDAIDFVQDPLGFLLQKLTEANLWFLRQMLELLQNSSKIDLSSPGFLKQYAIIFAASSLLTVALWLIAVAKRAVRGVAITTAVGEAVGLLLLQFVVNALTPASIALLMKAIDEVTAVFEPYAVDNFKPFLEDVLTVMASTPSEGVGQLLVVNLVMLCGALLMWVELLIRSAAIYVAVALAPIVNAGLVDRDLWGKSKKWFGAVFALGLSKPVLFALLGLGGAVLSDTTGSRSDVVSKTLVGALILLLAVFASATLYKWLPSFGDEMAQLNHDRKTAQSAGPAAAVDGPAQHTNRALNTHIQDSLVSGTTGGGKAPTAAGVKASTTATAKQVGTASAKVSAGTASNVGTATAGGPLVAAAATAKAGFDVTKNKAASAPGMQGAEAGNAGSGTGPETNPSGAPAAAPSAGMGSDPVISSGQGAPAAARGGQGNSGPVVGSAVPAQSGAQPPPPPARSTPSPASYPSGPVVGPPPASSPQPHVNRSGGETTIKPPTSKDS